jgi:UBX domain-containing protein 1/4
MAQALSLKCGVCGTQLKSVAEAQLHSETHPGHAQFEESVEALLNLTCTGGCLGALVGALST